MIHLYTTQFGNFPKQCVHSNINVCIFQAYEYEQSDKKPGFLQEFFDSTEGNQSTYSIAPSIRLVGKYM